jgi:hypothetical protein
MIYAVINWGDAFLRGTDMGKTNKKINCLESNLDIKKKQLSAPHI